MSHVIEDLILNLPASASNIGATAVKVFGGAGKVSVVPADIATSGAIDIDVTKAATSGTDSGGLDTNDAIIAQSVSGAVKVKVKAGELSTAGCIRPASRPGPRPATSRSRSARSPPPSERRHRLGPR